MNAPVSIAALKAQVGAEIGVSRWFTISQGLIDAYADVSEDHQYIHVDPDRAAEAGFGGTIAHGFLTVSLLSAMAYEVVPLSSDVRMSVNYGFDHLRFLSPVPSGSRVRGRFVLNSIEERAPGEVTLIWAVTVEIEGADRPALVANWITRRYLEPSV